MLHDVDVEDIPVKSYHTLFFPVYVLDARHQSSGGAGLSKWEPLSHIVVYLGHSPFHAPRRQPSISVESNQRESKSPISCSLWRWFHNCDINGAGTIPSNWEDLVYRSCESDTAKEVTLADVWLLALVKRGHKQRSAFRSFCSSDWSHEMSKDLKNKEDLRAVLLGPSRLGFQGRYHDTVQIQLSTCFTVSKGGNQTKNLCKRSVKSLQDIMSPKRPFWLQPNRNTKVSWLRSCWHAHASKVESSYGLPSWNNSGRIKCKSGKPALGMYLLLQK